MVDAATAKAVFKVIDAYDHPHGGRILRLRLGRGEAPPLKELKGASLQAVGPGGEERTITVAGFAVFGGRPTDERVARTGRVDVHVPEAEEAEASGGEASEIGAGWELVV